MPGQEASVSRLMIITDQHCSVLAMTGLQTPFALPMQNFQLAALTL